MLYVCEERGVVLVSVRCLLRVLFVPGGSRNMNNGSYGGYAMVAAPGYE